MIEGLIEYGLVLFKTILDVIPILVLVIFFQLVVLREPFPHLKTVIIGSIYVVLGLSLFLLGLEKALFPIGNIMATQLSNPEFLGITEANPGTWASYYWIYIFAALIGFSSAIAEPSLIAVAIKAGEVSGGTISSWGLRLTVALGVSMAMALGTFRIVTGGSLVYYVLGVYIVILILTFFAPRKIIPLAYDSGGVTTSTVTVPIVAAIGLGLATSVPGRNPAIDGFGLIALACAFPIISLLSFALFSEMKMKMSKYKNR